MKLILCKKCQDVVRLIQEEERTCKCGSCSGKYEDDLHAYYKGEHAVPMGFANSTLVNAVVNQPESGMGSNFTAFIIPKECPTFEKIE